MSEQKEFTIEFYETTLGRLRKRLVMAQDDMDVISFAIKSLEDGLEKAQARENQGEDQE